MREVAIENRGWRRGRERAAGYCFNTVFGTFSNTQNQYIYVKGGGGGGGWVGEGGGGGLGSVGRELQYEEGGTIQAEMGD